MTRQEKLEIMVKMWNDHSLEEISKECGYTVETVRFMAGWLRKQGIKLASKGKRGRKKEPVDLNLLNRLYEGTHPQTCYACGKSYDEA